MRIHGRRSSRHTRILEVPALASRPLAEGNHDRPCRLHHRFSREGMAMEQHGSNRMLTVRARIHPRRNNRSGTESRPDPGRGPAHLRQHDTQICKPGRPYARLRNHLRIDRLLPRHRHRNSWKDDQQEKGETANLTWGAD